MKNIACISLLFTLLSCDNEPDSNMITWQKNKNIWDKNQMTNYSFDFRASCFCVDDWVREVNVTVYSDTVANVIFTDDSLPPTELKAYQWYTISELFSMTRSIIQEAQKFEINYDKTYGNPEMISVDWDFKVADDEFIYYLSNVKKN